MSAFPIQMCLFHLARITFIVGDSIFRRACVCGDGTLLWTTLQHRMEPLVKRVNTLLKKSDYSGEPLAGQCRRIFNQRQYLWTFVHDARGAEEQSG